MRKNQLFRLWFDIVTILLILAILHFLPDDLGQLGILLLTPLKLSGGVLSWFAHRKLMFYYLPPVDWTKKPQDWSLYEVYTLISLPVFILAWTTSYS